jgi:pentatricopeptide repeat protein
MPIEMEKKLKKQVRKMRAKGKKVDEGAYVFGTMRKTGWKPSTQKGRDSCQNEVGAKKPLPVMAASNCTYTKPLVGNSDPRKAIA